MSRLPQERFCLYALGLGLLPLLLVLFFFFSGKSAQEDLLERMDYGIIQAKSKNSKEWVNKQIKKNFVDGDHFYIDKQIETIVPLSREASGLQKILQTGFHPQEEVIRKRLEFLTNGQNALSFVESSLKKYASFQETQDTLAHPVEVDLDDLKTIVSRIEGVPLTEAINQQSLLSGRPHLLISDFKIERKKGTTGEVFLLHLKIIKREYLK